MDKIFRVTYIINGIERTDDFVPNEDNPYYRYTLNGCFPYTPCYGCCPATMADNSTESAIGAIRVKFRDEWEEDEIEIKSIISGHVEYKVPPTRYPGLRKHIKPVFVAD